MAQDPIAALDTSYVYLVGAGRNSGAMGHFGYGLYCDLEIADGRWTCRVALGVDGVSSYRGLRSAFVFAVSVSVSCVCLRAPVPRQCVERDATACKQQEQAVGAVGRRARAVRVPPMLACTLV